MQQQDKQKTRVGVALGGGSARGYAHIGALSSLERHGIYPNVITGTSFGAVIGAFYAMGYSLDQIKKDALAARQSEVFASVIDFGLHKAALFSGDRMQSHYERLFEGRHFSDLKKEFHVACTDVDTGELVLIKDGPIATAIRASCSMPGVFAAATVNGRQLIDGGLAAPIPLSTLNNLNVSLAIGIGAGTRADDSQAIKLTQKLLKTSWGSAVHKGLHDSVSTSSLFRLGRGLAYTANTYLVGQQSEGLQVHTNPPISWLHFHKAAHAIDAGEQALNAFMPRILQAYSATRYA